MSSRVEGLLSQLKTNPAVVVELYTALSKELYIVLVRSGSRKDLEAFEFLTYPSQGCDELPIFTSDNYPLFNQLKSQSSADSVTVDGASLFKRLIKNVIDTDKIQVAINPGWEYGIRVSRSMLLSVIAVSETTPPTE